MTPREVTYSTLGDTIQGGGVTAPVALLTFIVDDVATVGVAAAGSITNFGIVTSSAWSIAAVAGMTVSPSSGAGIAPGGVVALTFTPTAGGTTSHTLTCAGATITGNPQQIVSAVAPSTATLSGSTTGTVDEPVTFTVTLDAVADQTYTITPSATNSAAVAPSTRTIAAGSSAGTFTVTDAIAEATSVDFTISPSLTRVGNPITLTLSAGALPGLTLSAVSATGVVGTPGSATITNDSATVACQWTLTPSAGMTATPSSGTLAIGASVSPVLGFTTTGTKTLTLTNNSGGTITGTNPASITVTAAAATSATLALSSSTGTSGVPTSGTVTLNGVAPSAGSVAIAGVGATITPSTLSWAAGESGAAKSFTITRATGGTTAVSITNTMGLSNLGATNYTTGPTTATLTGASSVTEDVSSTYIVTLDAAADQTYTITWAITGGTPASATSTITAGNTAASVGVTFPNAGAASVDFTIAPTLTRAGRPISVTVSAASTPGGFSLLSASTQAAAPFTAGFAFEPGAIPSGQGITIPGATAQATVKNTWPDGSVKFAIIAGTAALTADTWLTLLPAAGTASTGTALTTTDLQAALTQAVTIDAGAFGSASWSGADWASPFETWVSGHRMSSWVYRKPVGADAHLVAWLEVRLFPGGVVEVLPWVENGYLLVAGPTSKSATYTFTMGGTQRFSALIDLCHHQRTPLVSGTALSHWLGADPGVTVVHDTDYMQATGLVPAYHAKTPTSATAYTSLPATFTPLMLGSFTDGDGMSGGGFHNHIGLLPEWDVVYLTAPTAASAQALVRNGYTFGRYPIHYREDPTFTTANDRYKPVRLTNHPTLNLAEPSAGWETTPATSGTAPPGWATSHQPSVCFVAYLATGRRYFLDEVQFAASTNAMIDLKSTNRQGVLGLFKSQVAGNERHVAWCLRALAQAIAVTPDADTTYLAEFRAQYQNNMDYYHTRYIGAGGPSAPIFNNGGFVEPSSDVGTGGVGTYWVTVWMQDFITASLGYAKDLALGLDATNTTRLNEFFTWKADSIVKRFGFTGATEFLFRDYGPYYLPIAPTDTPDWTTGAGPWYHNAGNGWGDIYSVCYSGANPPDGSTVPYTAPGTKTEGNASIRVWFITNSGPIAALAAMAYAVKHGVSGAEAGYQRLTNAANWYSMKTDMDAQPLWAVAPRARPKWWRGVAVNQWVEIASSAISLLAPTNTARTISGGVSSGGAGTRMDAWCGLSVDNSTGKVYSAANGGHGDYYGNEVCAIDMMADVPAWAEVLAGSSGNVIYNTENIADATDRRYAQYTDGKPTSRHSYSGQQFIERHGRALTFGGSISPRGSFFENVESFNVATAQWDAYTAATQEPLYGYAVSGANNGWTPASAWSMTKDPTNECIYIIANGGTQVRKFTPGASSGGSYSVLGTAPFSPYPGSYAAMAVDTIRNRLVWMLGSSAPGVEIVWWDLSTGVSTTTTFPASSAATAMKASPALTGGAAAPSSAGCVFVPEIDAFLVRMGAAGATVYKVDAATFAVSVLSTTGGASVPTAAPFVDQQGIFNRWLYLPRLRGVAYYPKGAANAWFLRTH